MDLANYFKEKSYGYYVVWATAIAALFSIIVNAVGIRGGFFSWYEFACGLILIVGTAVLLLLKLDRFVPAFNFALSLLALCFFISACYNYVATVMTGIDIEEFDDLWVMGACGYALTFVLAICTVFMPLKKKDLPEEPSQKEILEENLQ